MQEHLTLSCFVIRELFFLVVVTTNCVLKERCENIQEHIEHMVGLGKGL